MASREVISDYVILMFLKLWLVEAIQLNTATFVKFGGNAALMLRTVSPTLLNPPIPSQIGTQCLDREPLPSMVMNGIPLE